MLHRAPIMPPSYDDPGDSRPHSPGGYCHSQATRHAPELSIVLHLVALRLDAEDCPEVELGCR